MGILFVKTVPEFSGDQKLMIGNRRMTFENMKFVRRVDLTFQTMESSNKVGYPYLEEDGALKQLLPVPDFLLLPLKKYRLPYHIIESDNIRFFGNKTVIYLHGSGSISEDNSILHGILLRNGCDLIRVSYHIDYEKQGVHYPKKAVEMLPFLSETELKISPVIHEELKSILLKIRICHPSLFENREVILMAHSLGGGLAANLAADFKEIHFSKFINLDGTLMGPARQTGIDISQLHLSQDRLFKKEWIDEEDSSDPLKAIGQDYCKKINALLSHSTNKSVWIQIKDSSHFTFTDFPNLLQPYKFFRELAGSIEAAERIRKYVLAFISNNNIEIDLRDLPIKS